MSACMSRGATTPVSKFLDEEEEVGHKESLFEGSASFGGRGKRSIHDLARFKNELEAFLDEYGKCVSKLKRYKEEEEDNTSKRHESRQETHALQSDLKELATENEVLKDQCEYLKELLKDKHQMARNSNATGIQLQNSTKELKGFKEECYNLKQALDESKHTASSLQRCLEGKCTIIDALSKEIKESQELISKGWDELSKTKEQVCSLSKGQYDNIHRLKQLEIELEKRQEENSELRKTLEVEKKGRKDSSQEKCTFQWALKDIQMQLMKAKECNVKLENALEDKEKEKEKYAKLALEGGQLTGIVQTLERYIGKESTSLDDNCLQLHLTIRNV